MTPFIGQTQPLPRPADACLAVLTRPRRSTGQYRRRGKGSGPAGTPPKTKPELRQEGRRQGRGRGTPIVKGKRVRAYVQRAQARMNKRGETAPVGPRPHPTKRGPGRC